MFKCNQGHDNEEGSQFCAVCGTTLLQSWSDMSISENSNSKRNIIILSSFLVPIVAILWFTILKPTPKHDLEIELMVVGANFSWLGNGDCYSGLTGYWDIREGTKAVISDSSGEILGTGSLTSSGSSVVCTYKTTILAIPEVKEGYSLTIGVRDPVTATKETLDANDWKWSLSIGL